MKINTSLLLICIFIASCRAPENVVKTTEIATPISMTKIAVDTSKIFVAIESVDLPKEIYSVEEEVVNISNDEAADGEIIEEKTEEIRIVTQEVQPILSKKEDTIRTLNHGLFDNLLKAHVNADGAVNYKGFKKNWSQLTAYISNLGENLPKEEWTKNKKLAYWMNAYNAMTVDLILRHQPLESIKDIKNPWEQRFWKLGDKYYNLDEIEHQILRKMGDPRIHFGINCASFSCPPLLNEAFTEADVDRQLNRLTIKFINDPKRNRITPSSVEISKIFDWFAKDFKKSGSVIDYLNRYAKTKIVDDAKVRYMDYNWALNN